MLETTANFQHRSSLEPAGRGTRQHGAVEAGRGLSTAPWSRVIRRVRRALSSAAELVRAGRARRLAYRELMAMDERLLRDVGISRCAIPALLRGTWLDGPQARVGHGVAEGGSGPSGRRPGAAAPARRARKAA